MTFWMTFRLVEEQTFDELYKIHVEAVGPVPMPIPENNSLVTIEGKGQYRASNTHYDFRRNGWVITTWVTQE
jgi:hypothetical protein